VLSTLKVVFQTLKFGTEFKVHTYTSIVFEKRVLRKIFVPGKREEVTGKWRKLHKEKLYN
jgi:hypothetical protein